MIEHVHSGCEQHAPIGLTSGVNFAAKRKQATPAFVELVTAADPLPECVVELENARGKEMRIHLRGVAAPDVVLLSPIRRGEASDSGPPQLARRNGLRRAKTGIRLSITHKVGSRTVN